MSLSGNTISGTPSHEAGFTFTITSTDSLGATGSQNYTLEILPGWGGGNQPLRVSEPMAGGAVMAMAAGDTLKYAFTHDAEGRMTAKGTQAYVYDALNRMTQVTGKESYLYDGHGRRVQVTKTSDSKKNYPLYGLDGKLLVEDNRQTLKRTEYIYANGRLIAKRIQPITAAGANNGTATVTTIHTDFLGSPVAETNSAGTVTRVERYTPYGEPADLQLDAGPGFTGHATDVATGLTYMQQRYYDADIGRFISPDPVGPEEDFIQHFNRYNYAMNNPVRYTDPDGRDVEVRLMAYKIGTAPIQGDYGHQYVHMRDTDSGVEMISRAGPSEPYPGGMSAVASGSAVDNTAGTGNVELVTSLTPASVSADSQNGKPLGSTVKGSLAIISGDIKQAAGKLQAFNNDVDSSSVAYKPTSTNSNAYAGTAYTVLTGKDAPSSDFLPGSDVNLVKENHLDEKK